jgi:perosamine synthetase
MIMNRKIPWWVPEIGATEYELIKGVLDSNYINDGEVTEQFERSLAALLEVKYAVAVTSGTAAIALGLAGLGVGIGDEVLVPDITFIATANAVKLAGAQPVLVDVDPSTLNIDPDAAEHALTARTRAIVPVHVSGRAAAMDTILALAQRHELFVVEDAAEGFVSRHGSRYLGTLGHAGCLSFSPNKTIMTGQGGAVLTDDERLYVRLRELKDQGRPVRGTGGDDIHHSVGYNFKFTNLQAAVGLAQLTYLETRLARMKRTYSIYANRLQNLKGIRLPGFCLDGGECPQWTDAIVERRDDLDRFLLARNVHCRRFWFPIHTQIPYRQPDELFPNSSALGPHAIWLPSAFTLSDADVNDVCDYIQEFLTSRVGEVANAGKSS